MHAVRSPLPSFKVGPRYQGVSGNQDGRIVQRPLYGNNCVAMLLTACNGLKPIPARPRRALPG
eukprot:7467279-Alexandrium_andersonii.AAC.1